MSISLPPLDNRTSVTTTLTPQQDATMALIEGLRASLSKFWSSKIPGWRNPVAWVYYTDAKPPTDSACKGGWVHNSAYCSSDGKIYIDLDFVRELATKFPTNAGVVWLLAHEFGHRVQDVTGALETHLPVGLELGADCLAGVFTDALEKGGYSVVLEAGDIGTMLTTVRTYSNKDFGGLSWLSEGQHGGPLERAQALATGYLTGDKAFCDPYKSTGPITTVTVQGYSLKLPPATTATKPASNPASLLVRSSVYPNLKLDLTGVTVRSRTAAAALAEASPGYFTGSQVRYVDQVSQFAKIGNLDTATIRYEQVQNGATFHGSLLLVTAGDGTAMVMDTFVPGAAPAATDKAGWNVVANAAYSALWGVVK